jgi:hypothetical protein
MNADQLTYSRGYLSAEQVEHEIARFWADVAASSELRAQLVATGLNFETLDKSNLPDAITVRVDSSGVDPVAVSLVIVFAPTANRILKDVWATVLLPRIRRRWGDDAIGEKTDHSDQ